MMHSDNMIPMLIDRALTGHSSCTQMGLLEFQCIKLRFDCLDVQVRVV